MFKKFGTSLGSSGMMAIGCLAGQFLGSICFQFAEAKRSSSWVWEL